MIQAIVCSFVPMSGAGMSLFGADHGQELGREAAREPLELAGRQLARVAAHAALRAAVGQPQQRALPRHPHRERGALAEVDVRVVADAALASGRARSSAGRGRRGTISKLPASRRTGTPTIVDRSGTAESLRDEVRYVGVLERLLELAERRAVERRIPLERRLLDRRFVELGHALSLGASVHEQSQLGLELLHHNSVPDVGAVHAARPPELAGDADLPERPAGLDDRPREACERLGAGRRRGGGASTRGRA